MDYTTTAGSFSDVKLYPENAQIDTVSRLTLEFKPNHAISKDSKLRIEIKKDLTVPCPTNFDYNSAFLTKPLQVQCSDAGDFFVIEADKPFTSDYTYLRDAEPIKIVFLGTKMPPS